MEINTCRLEPLFKKNERRDTFVNGTIDNDEINLDVFGVGGTTVLTSFDECCLSIVIDVKFVKY